jgi:hypothetical protein
MDEERSLLPDGTVGNFDRLGLRMVRKSRLHPRVRNSEIWVVNVDGTNLRQLTRMVNLPFPTGVDSATCGVNETGQSVTGVNHDDLCCFMLRGRSC